MSSGGPGAVFSADARSLEALRLQAKDAPEKALREAARQFEALFMGILLKSMREALPQEDELASPATRTYTSLLDQQLAQNMSSRGIGLADALVKQLSNSNSRAQPPAGGAPESFVRDMLPHARAAERETGIPAHFSLGQAALESGWGRREIRAADGTPSHNLFGIKAGAGWKGATVDTQTTEYVDGVPRKMVQTFRAYSSYGEAFKDYSRLLAGAPRYAGALEAAGDPAAFARAVHAGGYATDPDYAQKLTQVINKTLALQGSA